MKSKRFRSKPLRKSRRKSTRKSRRKSTRKSRRKSTRKSRRKSTRKSRRKILDGSSSWERVLNKHMKKRGFNLVRKGKHCVWENIEGKKIITSCTPKPSQYENILREIDRDIVKV
jgi:hypothetical protein